MCMITIIHPNYWELNILESFQISIHNHYSIMQAINGSYSLTNNDQLLGLVKFFITSPIALKNMKDV